MQQADLWIFLPQSTVVLKELSWVVEEIRQVLREEFQCELPNQNRVRKFQERKIVRGWKSTWGKCLLYGTNCCCSL